jgi:uncharacterized membrane protein
MTNGQRPLEALHLALWVAQVVLAASFIWAAGMKLFQPVSKLAAMWPWVLHVADNLVKFTGIVDLLGAIGLIIPSLLRIKPKLTAIASIGIIVLMIAASVFHIARGEALVIGVNIAFAVIAAFIAWGRFSKTIILSK